MRESKRSIMEGVEAQKSRLATRNTVEYWRANGDRVIRFHHTDILTFKPNGHVILDSGGWRTFTTKGRINQFLPAPWTLFQELSVWYLGRIDPLYTHGWRERMTRHVFRDSMSIKGDTVTGAGEAVDPRLPRRIAAYARAFVKALLAGDVPAPSNGDCWHCLMRTEDGQTLGESTDPSGHILGHMEERYHVPSLLTRALEVFPVSQAAQWVLGDLWGSGDGSAVRAFGHVVQGQLTSSIRRYVRRQLQLAS